MKKLTGSEVGIISALLKRFNGEFIEPPKATLAPQISNSRVTGAAALKRAAKTRKNIRARAPK